MGLLGRKVAGPTVGICAAAIAAVDPLWLQPIGSLMSESIYLVVIPLMLLLALRCLEEPTIPRFAVFGVVMALAVLVRSEAMEFIVLLGIPLLVFSAVPWRRRGLLGLGLLIGLTVVLGPWLIRNELQVGGAVLSDQDGLTLVGSYCPSTFDPHSSLYGSFDGVNAESVGAYFALSVPPPDKATGWTELALDRQLTETGRSYARAHLSALPRVMLAREELTWNVGSLDLLVDGGRNRTYEQLGRALYWLSLPFVILGSVVLARRSRAHFFVIFVPIVLVALTVALTYGSIRFRVAAQPSLAILAAIGGVRIAKFMTGALTLDRFRQALHPSP